MKDKLCQSKKKTSSKVKKETSKILKGKKSGKSTKSAIDSALSRISNQKKDSENNQDRNFKLTIKNVRCFAKEQYFDIRPLTFLVGENSTGKTTVISCFSIIYDCISRGGWYTPDFNKDPYSMGSFVDIARKSNGKNSHQKASFELGITHDASNLKYKFHFKKQDKVAEPILNQAAINFEDVTFFSEKKGQKIIYMIDKNNEILLQDSRIASDDISLSAYIIDPYIPRFLEESSINQKEKIAFEAWRKLRSHRRKYFLEEIFSLAPIRSKPQRTYNPVKESLSSEGSEIPVTLLRLSHQDDIWKKIRKKLVDFGKSSGLFSDVEVKKYGSTGEPFQLQFQVKGIQSNIIDTGYGISQILPLLVRLFTSDIQKKRYPIKKGTRFLLQQPEVHLHPKAQAELASLLIQSAKINNSFLIETHSDYILDRVRIEIRKGNISHHHVSLIYLESTKNGVQAHNILFDKQGNLITVPTGYRDFFIKESNWLLGFEN